MTLIRRRMRAQDRMEGREQVTLRRRTPTQPGALSILATAGRDGATQPLLCAHGLSTAMIARLVSHGLATLTYEKVRAGGKACRRRRGEMTDAERDALGAER